MDNSMFYGASVRTFEAARILRRNMTLAEKIIWKKLRNKNLLDARFRRQHPINIFIVDFYCHKLKLVIEIDGEIHFDKKAKKYDSGRTGELEKMGLRVIRFTNDQVLYKLDSVISEIFKVITELAPLQGGRGVE
jgi:very-short-patch-repair endonuclease